jgi:hypothetical protein
MCVPQVHTTQSTCEASVVPWELEKAMVQGARLHAEIDAFANAPTCEANAAAASVLRSTGEGRHALACYSACIGKLIIIHIVIIHIIIICFMYFYHLEL